MQSYKNLQVWQRAVQFSVEIYRMTRDFPKHELYGGLTDQIRRLGSFAPSQHR